MPSILIKINLNHQTVKQNPIQQRQFIQFECPGTRKGAMRDGVNPPVHISGPGLAMMAAHCPVAQESCRYCACAA